MLHFGHLQSPGFMSTSFEDLETCYGRIYHCLQSKTETLWEGRGKSVYEGTWRKSSGNVRPALSPSRDLNANMATANLCPVYSVDGIFSIAGILELYKRKTRGLPGDPYFRDLTVVRN